MKILQISSVPIDYIGGTEKIVWELSKKLSKNHQVTILQTNLYMPEKRAGKIRKENVEIITCKNNYFLGGYGYSPRFKKMLKNIWKKYDVIHIHGYGRFSSDFALKFLKRKKPTIFTAHGFFHSKKSSSFKKLHYKLKGNLIKNASFCTALTELEKRQYLKLGVKENKIKIVPNGIDVKRFDIKLDKKLKNKYAKGKKLLIYVGRIHESKGLQHILKAIKDLDLKFLVVGRKTPYKKHLEKLVSELKIKNKVEFIENADDKLVSKLYSVSDAFILFSAWEGFGVTVIESMASKLPVIVSSKGALPFLVKNGVTGLIVKYPDVEELKNKIDVLIKNKTKREKLGKAGKKFSKNFDWEQIVKKYENIYKKSLEKLNG